LNAKRKPFKPIFGKKSVQLVLVRTAQRLLTEGERMDHFYNIPKAVV
jgi:hypothetical protein